MAWPLSKGLGEVLLKLIRMKFGNQKCDFSIMWCVHVSFLPCSKKSSSHKTVTGWVKCWSIHALCISPENASPQYPVLPQSTLNSIPIPTRHLRMIICSWKMLLYFAPTSIDLYYSALCWTSLGNELKALTLRTNVISAFYCMEMLMARALSLGNTCFLTGVMNSCINS